MKPTLLLVHTSSLDALSMYDRELAMALARRLALMVSQRPSPFQRIVHMDQQWEYSLESGPRKLFDGAAKYAIVPISRVYHDEMEVRDPWGKGLRPVLDEIAKGKPKRIDVAGLWATKDGRSGCVSAAAEVLARSFPRSIVRILPDLTAYEEWV